MLVFFPLVALLSRALARTPTHLGDILPGWMGERRQATSVQDSTVQDAPWLEQVSWEPRAYVYHNFLTWEECDHIIGLARPHIEPSTVVDHKTGGSVLDQIRTSFGMFLPRQFDEVVARVEERVANWTQFPVENGEDIQVLRYENGQKYGDHFDYFDATVPNALADGQRAATVLMYLSDVEEGGETCFHNGFWVDEAKQKPSGLSSCADRGVCVRPTKGAALLFHNLLLGGREPDLHSLHTGCPVIRGTKWSATKWIHTQAFRPSTLKKPDLNACEDRDVQCENWASRGECTKNPGFMVGTLITPGACRLACKVCVKCAEGDVLCMRKNYKGGTA